MLLADLLTHYRDGDEHGWGTEFAYLREHHAGRLAVLRADIATNGIQTPIHIGDDARIWDGHHRLCVADELGITDVPIIFNPQE